MPAVAFFLLARGPYAWIGWGTWGMTWPFNAEPAHGELPPLPVSTMDPIEHSAQHQRPASVALIRLLHLSDLLVLTTI